MNGFSPWYYSDGRQVAGALWRKQKGDVLLETTLSDDSLWLRITFRQQPVLAMRAGYFPGNGFRILKTDDGGRTFSMQAATSTGRFRIMVSLPDQSYPMLRCTTYLTPATDFRIPFWPRDLMVLQASGKQEALEGKVHVRQEGGRSGWLFGGIESADPCAFLYFQNLTALNDYAIATHSKLTDTVGGAWPELGFGLPPSPEKALPAGKEIVISDAFLMLHESLPAKENDLAALFLEMTGRLYLQLPLPPTSYKPWPDILSHTLRDLQVNCGCWFRAGGHSYLNAYLCDYDTPPELMVQLAVLLPLMDYERWSNEPLKIVQTLKDGIPFFYDEKINATGRWLPSTMDRLDLSEEHKHPRVMDSWYLHHPLVNLARMVKAGEDHLKDLLFNSVEFAIKVAHHFKYEWPVFYHLDTLEVIKAETQPGKGGEHDVAGIYAHLMLLMHEISGEDRFLEEAATAGRALEQKGFHLFYQANVTAFAAKALLRLYIIKKEKVFLQAAMAALAGIMRNTGLWDCNYGNGEGFPTFFILYPLNNAPYAAVYEELEVMASFHDIIKMAPEAGLPSHITLLLSEYIRYMVHRCAYYYPPMIDKSMIAEKTKTGEIETDTWIPLEDLQDGWETSGTVGQEVYGAGLPFAIVSRHYSVLEDWGCIVFLDYPISEKVEQLENGVAFQAGGHPDMFCRLRLMPMEGFTLTDGQVQADKEMMQGIKLEDGSLEFSIPGQCRVELHFG